MNFTLSKTLYTLLASLGLAIVFNFLFFYNQVGISVFIFVAVLLGVVFVFGRSQQLVAKDALQNSWWLIALIGLFSLMPAVRANGFLAFLNIVTVFGLLMVLAYHLVGVPAFMMKLRDYVVLAMLVPFRMLARMFASISFISQVRSNVKHRDVWIRVLKGIIMAVPVLIVFALLFSNADLAFSQFLNSVIDIQVEEVTMQYLALLGFAFIAGLSYLSFIFFPKPQASPIAQPADSAAKEGKAVEVMVFLGLIATLFIVFIGFQVTYLFGGEANIINAGFTYAEYARRGFWELLAVSIISLVVLFAAEKYSGSERKRHSRFLVPALILIGEVVIIIVSAFKRLSLYIDAYGITTQRFYVASFIALLLVLFVLLAVKFVRSKREQFFSFGALLTFAGFLAVINIINPDGFIMKSNIKHYEKTGKVDVLYTEELSVDALPYKLELYDRLHGEEKEVLRNSILNHKAGLSSGSSEWQAANLSRSQALNILRDF
ncbi:DUF4173 domain-containing protein [bacterium]|nr:MAG: DUF4173 domain-containing protein [bacterium]